MRFFVLLLILVASVAFSQQSDQRGEKREHPNKPYKTQRQSTSDGRGTEKSPLVIGVLPTSEGEGRPDHDRKDHEEIAALDRQLVELTASLAGYTRDLGNYTVWLVGVTFVLAAVTAGLVVMAWRQETRSKRHERAYITFGALVGVPRKSSDPIARRLRPSAKHFKGPWRMALYNFGRTAGYTVLAQWGICPRSEFAAAHVSVSEIIDCGLLRNRMRDEIATQDVLGPTGNRPMHYRHMTVPDRDEIIGWVIFGRIIYRDVFRETHYSTFAYEITEDYTNGLPSSLSDDHGDGDPRDRRKRGRTSA